MNYSFFLKLPSAISLVFVLFNFVIEFWYGFYRIHRHTDTHSRQVDWGMQVTLEPFFFQTSYTQIYWLKLMAEGAQLPTKS